MNATRMMKTRVRLTAARYAALFFLTQCCCCMDALTHYTQPVLRWKTQLGDGTIASAQLKRRNAIVPSNDGSTLYVTLDDGSLAVLSASTGSVLTKYVPPSAPIAAGKQGWTVSNSRSGVSISSQTGDLVYAVQDSPPPFRWNGTFWYQYEGWYASGTYNNALLSKLPPASYPPRVESSRIISLDSSGRQRWMYTLKGIVVGTPTYGLAVQNDGSKLVYVLLNVNNTGQFTILRESPDGSNVQPMFNLTSSGAGPFSPMTVIRSRTGSDAVYWSETMSSEPGYDHRGRMRRVLVNSTQKITSSNGRHEYVGSGTRPLLSNDGTAIWIAGKGSRVFKLDWQADTTIWSGTNNRTMWSAQLVQSLRNETMPLMSAPVLSSSGELLFIPSTSTAFYCVDASTGSVLWTLNHTKRSIYMTEPRLSPDDNVVYSILHMDGTVIAQDARTGAILWEISCKDISGVVGCQDSVEAEFALSADGTQLYYGDFKGTVVSLTIADI